MAVVNFVTRPQVPYVGKSLAPSNAFMRQFIWFGVYDDFEFPYAPRAVQFESMSAEIAEIARPRRYPLVQMRGLNLTKVSFSFTIADRASGGMLPVDDQLRRLRIMAMRDTNVTFHGFDRLIQYAVPEDVFTDITQRDLLTVSWWKITNLSVSVKQRTSGVGAFRNSGPRENPGYVGNSIAVAECSISLTEWRNPNIPFQWLPQLTYPVQFPGGGGGSNSDGIFNVGDGIGYADEPGG